MAFVDYALGVVAAASAIGTVGAGCGTLVPQQPEWATDGNDGTESNVCNAVTTGGAPWRSLWTWNLGEVRWVERCVIRLTNATAYHGTGSGSIFRLFYSNDGASWTFLMDLGLWGDDFIHTFNFKYKPAQYWRLEWGLADSFGGLRGTNGIGLKRFELWANPPPILVAPEGPETAYPVIRGTSLVGTGSSGTTSSGGEADHDANQIGIIDSGGNFTSTNVEGALQELAAGDHGLAVHLADASDAHDASAVSINPVAGMVATTAQTAVIELAEDLAEHTSDLVVPPHDASEISFSPVGDLTATNVQDAIAEMAAGGASSGSGPVIGGLTPAMTTSPNIVTTDGTAIWLPAVLPDGSSVTVESD